MNSKNGLICGFLVLLVSFPCFATFCLADYSSSSIWSFGNTCYLGYNFTPTFAYPPRLGVTSESNMTGYWPMDEEESGTLLDASGANNTGQLLNGTQWATGKFYKGLSFDGTDDCVSFRDNSFSNLSSATISMWVKPTISSTHTIFCTKNGVDSINSIILDIQNANSNKARLLIRTATATHTIYSNSGLGNNTWSHIVVSMGSSGLSMWVNGVLQNNTDSAPLSFSSIPQPQKYFIGQLWYGGSLMNYYKGQTDDFRIYNYALNSSEVATLYNKNVLAEQPNPILFSNYTNFVNSQNNSMLIYVKPTSVTPSVDSKVTCINFFSNSQLEFSANNSVEVNLWTNLGRPTTSTNAVWNSQNATVTVTLTPQTTSLLDWSIALPPTVSNLNCSSNEILKQSIFSALWSDERSFSGGGFIFSTNNTGSWVNASWSAFSSNPAWANVTFTLTGTANVVVGFREYANNSLNVWGDTGAYYITTKNTPTATPTVTPKPTSVPTTTSTPDSTPKPTATTQATPTPTSPLITPTSTPQPDSSPNFTQLLLFGAVGLAVSAVLFGVAFRKGYISIETSAETAGA